MIEKIKATLKNLRENLFKRVKKEGVELTELSIEEKSHSLKIEKLFGFQDVDRVARIVRDGNILFLNVKDLQKKDLAEFQNSLVKLKRICTQFKWDLVGIEDGYLIIAPEFAVIERK